AVQPVQGEQQIRLLGLGRHAGRRSGPLHVDDHQRQLGHEGQRYRLRLQGDARPRRAGHRQVAGEGGADRRADGGDLVFRLERLDAEVAVPRQLVEDVGGGSDRVRAVEQRQVGRLGGGDQAPGEGDVAGDVRVRARRQGGGLDLERDAGGVGGDAEVVSRLEGGDVGGRHLRLVLELLLTPFDGGLRRAVEQPRQQAQGEEVL